MLSTERFQDRVDDYVRYRPSYPVEVRTSVIERCGLQPSSVIADFGSGTGLLAQLFLESGFEVYGVEPNAAMRAAAERLLVRFPRFRSIEGTAEASGLPGRSCDLVTCGQSFHWFDPVRSREECQRILCPGGWVVLVWNVRRTGDTPFLDGYEALLRRHTPEYEEIERRRSDPAAFDAFFGAGKWDALTLAHSQSFDYEGALGRLRSSSYSPVPGAPGYPEIEQELRTLFTATAVDGKVAFLYDTKVYFGRPGGRVGI
ncbi:MAG TPA: class I SAM-dependent methyltransferase [Bryobacteraceae bacterium]|jgi:SAM-dependent methyltransferase|nr:class I SAM-dependent methyltransferase [Bryobacteraceae bacterium]